MKILYHHRTVAKDGMSVHITELVAALRARGHEVTIVGPSADGETGTESNGGLIGTLRRWAPRFVTELLELAYDTLATRRLDEAYHRMQPDIIYERYNLFLLSGARLKRRYGVPLILEVNAPLVMERMAFGGLTWTGIAKRWERLAWQAADMVCPVSGPLARIVATNGVPPARITVIPNGIRADMFHPEADGSSVRASLGISNKTIIGFTGFVRDWHGLDRVIRFLVDQKRPDLHFLVVGDGPARAALESLAQETGVADQLTLTGVVPHDDIAGYVAAFDIALQPASVPYASPLKLFEYMAMARPIVAPDQENIREIVTHEESAFLFDPKRPGAFEDALRAVCDDRALREKLANGAAEAIERQQFTWDANAERIETIARTLIGARSEPVARS